MRKLLKGLTVVGIIVIIGFTVFVKVQQHFVAKEIDQHEQKRAEIMVSMERLKSVRNVPEKLQAVKTFERLSENQVLWSKILTDIMRYERTQIRFDDFNSSGKGDITIAARATSMESVALLIEELKSNPRINQVFVASVNQARGKDSLGYQFALSFSYKLP